MISKSFLYIILVTIINFTYVICDQCETWNNKISTEATYHCYEQNKIEKCESKPINFTIHEPNEDGTINFEFDYTPYCEYELELFKCSDVNDAVSCNSDKTTCETTLRTLHSKYKYSGISELDNDVNLQRCTERGKIILKYITTGCYRLKFNEISGNNEISDYTFFTMPKERKLHFIDFKSESYFFIDSRPRVDPRSSDSRVKTYLDIKHPFLEQNPNIELKIKCKNNCSKGYGPFYIVPSINKFNTEGLMEYSLCNNNTSDIDISCRVIRNIMKCDLVGLESGEYEFKFSLNNLIRCPSCISCYWIYCSGSRTQVLDMKGIIDELSINSEHSSPPTKYSSVYWIFGGLACIGGFVVIAIIVSCRGKPSGNDDTDIFIPSDNEAFSGQSKVLLLYPRDAEIVMGTMESLRKALIADGFEVHDVYDENEQKSINENEDKWIINKLSNKFMKTVIVQTYCGQILLNSSHSAYKLYKKPMFYDNIFPYAISLIGQRVDPKSYTKLFIVNIGFDQMEYNQFIFCNPSTRYTLPHSYKELTRDLRGNKDCSIDIQNNKELKEFTSTCKKMNDYIADPGYLSEILNVSISRLDDNIKIEEI